MQHHFRHAARQKYAHGPMGLDELTSYKWLGVGNGQIRS
jgi:gamma-glutamyl phosphate reductase